jgi:hypothetical protein
MSAAVKKIELTEMQIRIIQKLVEDSLQEDLLFLESATEKGDEKLMFTLMTISLQERKILDLLAA